MSVSVHLFLALNLIHMCSCSQVTGGVKKKNMAKFIYLFVCHLKVKTETEGKSQVKAEDVGVKENAQPKRGQHKPTAVKHSSASVTTSPSKSRKRPFSLAKVKEEEDNLSSDSEVTVIISTSNRTNYCVNVIT